MREAVEALLERLDAIEARLAALEKALEALPSPQTSQRVDWWNLVTSPGRAWNELHPLDPNRTPHLEKETPP